MFISIWDSVGVILSLCVDFCTVRLFSRCFSWVSRTRLCSAVQMKWAGQLTLPLRGTPRHDAHIWTVDFLQEAGVWGSPTSIDLQRQWMFAVCLFY